jgi:hypothetical protein
MIRPGESTKTHLTPSDMSQGVKRCCISMLYPRLATIVVDAGQTIWQRILKSCVRDHEIYRLSSAARSVTGLALLIHIFPRTARPKHQNQIRPRYAQVKVKRAKNKGLNGFSPRSNQTPQQHENRSRCRGGRKRPRSDSQRGSTADYRTTSRREEHGP